MKGEFWKNTGNTERVRKALKDGPLEFTEIMDKTGMDRGLLGYTLRSMLYRSAVYKRCVYWLPVATPKRGRE